MPSVSTVGHVNRGCRATLFETSVVVHQPAFAGAAHPLYGQSLSLRESYKWLRTSENSVLAKFAQCDFSALGPSFFDATAPAQTRAHLSDGRCQRICLRHLLYPATTSNTRIVYC